MGVKKCLILFTGFILVMVLLPGVLAEDGGGEDAGDLAKGFGIATVVMFGLASLNGLLIFTSTRKSGAAMFKKVGIKPKYIWKTHHLFNIPAIALGFIHGLLIHYGGGGGEDFGANGWTALVALVIVFVTGFFFPVAKGNARKVLRVVHFACMIIGAVMMGIHVAMGE